MPAPAILASSPLLALSPDGQHLAASVGDQPRGPGRVGVWEVATGNQQNLRESSDVVARIMAMSPDGRHWAMDTDSGKASIRDLTTRQTVRQLQVSDNHLTDLA